MTIFEKDGLVALTQIMKHGCRLLTRYRTKMDQAIAAAVTAGVITSGQQVTLGAFLDGFTIACDILRLVTGY